MTPAAQGGLFLMPGDDDLRLAAFRAKYPPPRVVIRRGQFDTWEALVPEFSGQGIIVRHTLRELLGNLEELFAGDEPDSG